jgi:hypothetical protein
MAAEIIRDRSAEDRVNELVDAYGRELDAWANERVPKLISNGEYAARSAAIMIALNRELARVAVAFGEAHDVGPGEVADLILSAFVKNHRLALQAVQPIEGVLIQ